LNLRNDFSQPVTGFLGTFELKQQVAGGSQFCVSKQNDSLNVPQRTFQRIVVYRS
jgi:hypothetical protein